MLLGGPAACRWCSGCLVLSMLRLKNLPIAMLDYPFTSDKWFYTGLIHSINAFFSPPARSRFYQSWPAHPRPALLRLRLCFKAPDQWALPDLNRELQSSVGTARPQARAPDVSGHCGTSTVSSPLDLNSERQSSVGTAGPQCLFSEMADVYGHWENICQNIMLWNAMVGITWSKAIFPWLITGKGPQL